MDLTVIYFFLIASYNGLTDCSTNGILDLSYPVNNLTLDWAGETFQLNITSDAVFNSTTGNISYWYQADTIWTPTHLGTHLDAPCHFARDVWCVSDIPIERLYLRPGYVIDISSKTEANPDYALTSEDVKDWFKSIGSVKPGAVILIRTNWSKYWPDRKKYFGLKKGPTERESFHFPGISVSSVETLIVLGVNFYGIGIESPSVDQGSSEDFATHRLLATHNIYNLENIGPLIGQLPKDNFLITSLPVRIDSASGSPCRIVAQLTNNSTDSVQSYFVMLTLVIIAITYYRNY